MVVTTVFDSVHLDQTLRNHSETAVLTLRIIILHIFQLIIPSNLLHYMKKKNQLLISNSNVVEFYSHSKLERDLRLPF